MGPPGGNGLGIGKGPENARALVLASDRVIQDWLSESSGRLLRVWLPYTAVGAAPLGWGLQRAWWSGRGAKEGEEDGEEAQAEEQARQHER